MRGCGVGGEERRVSHPFTGVWDLVQKTGLKPGNLNSASGWDGLCVCVCVCVCVGDGSPSRSYTWIEMAYFCILLWNEQGKSSVRVGC